MRHESKKEAFKIGINDVVETIYLAAFICNTLLCRFREEDKGVVFDIFLGMMKRASIFIRVICNNRSIFSLIANIELSCSWTSYGLGNEQLKAQLQTLF